MIKFLKRLHINIFTLLLMAAGIGMVFRLANIITFESTSASAISSARAVGETAAVETSKENAPPLTPEQIKKSIEETAKTVNSDAKLPEEGADSIQPPSTGEKKDVPADTSSEARSFSASEIEVLQSLSKRRDELNKREQQLGAREALLRAAEQEVDKKVTELNTLKADIEKLLGQQQTMEDSRILSLVKIYEGMKPKEAATIFNTLDMDVLLAVISRMSERKSSPVLAAMDPNKARIVTIKLAEQRQLPATPKPSPVAPPALIPNEAPADEEAPEAAPAAPATP